MRCRQESKKTGEDCKVITSLGIYRHDVEVKVTEVYCSSPQQHESFIYVFIKLKDQLFLVRCIRYKQGSESKINVSSANAKDGNLDVSL